MYIYIYLYILYIYIFIYIYRCIGRVIFGSFKKNTTESREKKNRRVSKNHGSFAPKRPHACCSKTGALGLQSHEPTPISLRALFGFGGATRGWGFQVL